MNSLYSYTISFTIENYSKDIPACTISFFASSTEILPDGKGNPSVSPFGVKQLRQYQRRLDCCRHCGANTRLPTASVPNLQI